MKLNKRLVFAGQLLSLFLLIFGFYLFLTDRDFTLASPATEPVTEQQADLVKEDETVNQADEDPALPFPQVSLDDWEILLVNRQNRVNELNPDLAVVGNILVDRRIEQATWEFLMAAQAIDPMMHLISGYRSVAEQEQIYQSYIAQEMAAQGLTEEEAIERVQVYSQPAGASEHHTGLAIDISTVDALNQMDTAVAAQLQALAPNYGFVLRFPADKQAITGIGYEDWHYRYVGVESAQYMTAHQLTLEEYIEEIRGRNP